MEAYSVHQVDKTSLKFTPKFLNKLYCWVTDEWDGKPNSYILVVVGGIANTMIWSPILCVCSCYKKYCVTWNDHKFAKLVLNFHAYLIGIESLIQQFFFKPFAYDQSINQVYVAVNSFIL